MNLFQHYHIFDTRVMEANEMDLKLSLNKVCKELEVEVSLRDFQVKFFEKAINGHSGFLRVSLVKSIS